MKGGGRKRSQLGEWGGGRSQFQRVTVSFLVSPAPCLPTRVTPALAHSSTDAAAATFLPLPILRFQSSLIDPPKSEGMLINLQE